jgi:anti-anti-sigma regulatory factor
VGIFSLFGKKNRQPEQPAEKAPARTKRSSSSRTSASKSAVRTPTVKRDAQAARATALKIDAIESEMSSEFVTTPPSPARRTTAAPKPAAAKAAKPNRQPVAAEAAAPELVHDADLLLEEQSEVGAITAPSSDAGAVLEEAAIMYANGQHEPVEQMLSLAIAEDALGECAQRAWMMLFDLYQIAGKQTEFEHLAMAYANKVEASPPAWSGCNSQCAAEPAAGATPMVPFSGALDAARCGKQIERIQKLAQTYRTLRLEFTRVTTVDTAGCGMLLGALKKLQKSEHELILAGATELAEKIRATLEVGRRDDGEDAWLLLLEILRLLNREYEFEEISIDYCVTFEVSPPAFVAPRTKVTTATEAAPAEGFPMPKVVEGRRIDDLIVAIAAYSDEHSPAVIDCSQLTRIDFNAAGRLLTGLAPFCGMGKVLEFHHVSHLIAELFKVIGLHDVAKILPRKN